MEDLRWILLAAGVALIAGLYLWGRRGRGRGAAADPGRGTRVEPPAAARVDPQLGPARADVEPEEALPVIELDRDERRGHGGGAKRAEPRLETGLPESAVPGEEDRPAPVAGAPRAEARRPAPDAPAGPAPGAEPREPEQKVIALRIVSAAAAPFPGRTLREAIEAQDLAFGRYRIFHRLHADGRPVFSLASLKEPGTFDLDTLDEASVRGVAMFVVLPGPLDGASAFDALVDAARGIAGRLGGLVQDERGVALGATRTGQLRAEAAAYGPVQPGT